MLRSRGHSPVAVVVEALDLHDVGALLAPMLLRESMRVHLRLGEGAPPATTTRHQPAVRRAARPGKPPAVCHVGQGSPDGVKN